MNAYVAAAILSQGVGVDRQDRAHSHDGVCCGCGWLLMSTLPRPLGESLRKSHTSTGDLWHSSSRAAHPRSPLPCSGHLSSSADLIERQRNERIFHLWISVFQSCNVLSHGIMSGTIKIPFATCQVYRCLIEGRLSFINFPIDGWRSVTMAPIFSPWDSKKLRLLSNPSFSILWLLPTSLLWNKHINKSHYCQITIVCPTLILRRHQTKYYE